MQKLLLTLGAIASLATITAPGMADAHRYHHYYSRHGCEVRRHRGGAIGAVAGAVGGGIIGSSLGHGNAGATLLGAGAGALTGNAIARGSHGC